MFKSRTRVPAIAIAGVGLALGLAACGGSSGSAFSAPASSSSSSSSSSAPSSSAPSSSAPSSSSSASSSSAAPTTSSSAPAAAGPTKTVTANEAEFSISLSTKTFTPGTYTFDVKNGGSATHALEIDGPGVDKKSTGNIAAGKSATLTVTLKAGTYDVNCPVANHKMLGMDLKIKVA